MDLKSGYPFWAIKNGLMHQAPRLTAHHDTDVLIIGAGITGALICDQLLSAGHRVTMIDERDVAWGSTSASTALLQYEIDTPLSELTKLYGEEMAVLAYRACAAAVGKVGEVVERLGGDVDYARQASLYYASSDSDVEEVRAEYEQRKAHGFDVRLVAADELSSRFGILAPLAILSSLAARMDPYRFTSKLLTMCVKEGAQVFDRTTVEGLVPTANGVRVQLGGKALVNARNVVIAAGYASQRWLKASVASNRSSYAFVTDPMTEQALGALRETMIWESARPYLYLRTTGDGRVLVGGEDDAVDIAVKRDASVERKASRLVEKVKGAMPQLDLEPAFAWAGTFAETDDGLPFFGSHPEWGPSVKFAMAYGGNGITYSVIGAEILRAELAGDTHPLGKLFSFERHQLRIRTGVVEQLRKLWRNSET